jgi:hypothetical protein
MTGNTVPTPLEDGEVPKLRFADDGSFMDKFLREGDRSKPARTAEGRGPASSSATDRPADVRLHVRLPALGARPSRPASALYRRQRGPGRGSCTIYSGPSRSAAGPARERAGRRAAARRA